VAPLPGGGAAPGVAGCPGCPQFKSEFGGCIGAFWALAGVTVAMNDARHKIASQAQTDVRKLLLPVLFKLSFEVFISGSSFLSVFLGFAI
jgi:hypothetical protein